MPVVSAVSLLYSGHLEGTAHYSGQLQHLGATCVGVVAKRAPSHSCSHHSPPENPEAGWLYEQNENMKNKNKKPVQGGLNGHRMHVAGATGRSGTWTRRYSGHTTTPRITTGLCCPLRFTVTAHSSLESPPPKVAFFNSHPHFPFWPIQPSQPSHTFAFCSLLVDCFPFFGGLAVGSPSGHCAVHGCTSGRYLRSDALNSGGPRRFIHAAEKLNLPAFNYFPRTVMYCNRNRNSSCHYPQIIIHRYSAERGSQCQLNSLHSSSRHQFP